MLLFRPIGLYELEWIHFHKFKSFKDRFISGATFDLLLDEEIAEKIARESYPKEEAFGFAGYVARIDVDSEYISKFVAEDTQDVRVPVLDFDEFNSHINGDIEVTHAFQSKEYLQRFREGSAWDWTLKHVQSVTWRLIDFIKCHEHCDVCQSTLCSEHPANTGSDWQTAFSGELDEVEYFLCPPCFAVFQDIGNMKLEK